MGSTSRHNLCTSLQGWCDMSFRKKLVERKHRMKAMKLEEKKKQGKVTASHTGHPAR